MDVVRLASSFLRQYLGRVERLDSHLHISLMGPQDLSRQRRLSGLWTDPYGIWEFVDSLHGVKNALGDDRLARLGAGRFPGVTARRRVAIGAHFCYAAQLL